MRQTAVQKYIPDHMRARLNACQDIMMLGVSAALTIIIGALGEVLDYRLCMTLAAGFTLAVCWLTIWTGRRHVRAVYELPAAQNA